MPSNYSAITADNIKRRGTEFSDIGRMISEQLYSDRTHFVFELIQNAEDALSRRHQLFPESDLPRKLEFRLFLDRLEVRHFGVAFNENDVKAISDILKGTKSDDTQQIGRFGIGFKSVYAFTSSPEIHCGDEHFKLTDYIEVSAVPEKALLPGETLFVFPFNHHRETAEKTYKRIEDRLCQLDEHSILFLEYVDEISWVIDEKPSCLRRTIENISQDCDKILINKNEIQSSWLVFSKETSIITPGKVAAAFKLQREEGTSGETIKPVKRSPLVVFLPTGLETDLHFLIHGPYLTTPARDNILKEDCEENAALINLTARLVAEVPIRLRDDDKLAELSLLNIDFYNTLPLRPEDFEKNETFKPVFIAVKNAFSNHSLLPSVDIGEYITAQQAKLARGSELRSLLSSQQLCQLLNKDCTWVSKEITAKGSQTSDFYQYLRVQLEVEEIEAENFARLLNLRFLASQSDGWFARLYAFLNSRKALRPIVSRKPIVRLEDDRHVLPIKRDNNQPNAYLPGGNELTTTVHGGLATVKRAIFSDIATKQEAKSFLRSLGLAEPDVVAEVVENILPCYTPYAYGKIKEAKHHENIQTILKAIKGLKSSISVQAQDKLDYLKQRLKETPFLSSVNASHANQKTYHKPQDLYFPEADLKSYFHGYAYIWFLNGNEIEDGDITLLEELGVRKKTKVLARAIDKSGCVILKESHGNHQRGLEGFDPKIEIEGLEYALDNPTVRRSAFIWNNILLAKKRCTRCIAGYVESSNRKNYVSAQTNKCFTVSAVGSLLRTKRWLPDEKGRFYRPDNISVDKLHPSFATTGTLATFLVKQLEMKPSAYIQNGKNQLPPEFRNISTEYLEFVLHNPEKIADLIKQQLGGEEEETEQSNKMVKAKKISNIEYSAAFQQAFHREGQDSSVVNKSLTPRPVLNPKRRKNKISLEIERDKSIEAESAPRFQQVSSKVWERKNNQVRPFLMEEYKGKCQICGHTFTKRDGERYFEGVYIVSYTEALWLDRPGNVLCMCSNCCAKFKHGKVVAKDNIYEKIKNYVPAIEGGDGFCKISLNLCGEDTSIIFSERHAIETQALLNHSDSSEIIDDASPHTAYNKNTGSVKHNSRRQAPMPKPRRKVRVV